MEVRHILFPKFLTLGLSIANDGQLSKKNGRLCRGMRVFHSHKLRSLQVLWRLFVEPDVRQGPFERGCFSPWRIKPLDLWRKLPKPYFLQHAFFFAGFLAAFFATFFFATFFLAAFFATFFFAIIHHLLSRRNSTRWCYGCQKYFLFLKNFFLLIEYTLFRYAHKLFPVSSIPPIQLHIIYDLADCANGLRRTRTG